MQASASTSMAPVAGIVDFTYSLILIFDRIFEFFLSLDIAFILRSTLAGRDGQNLDRDVVGRAVLDSAAASVI